MDSKMKLILFAVVVMILNLITFTSMPTMLMKRQHFSTKLEISKKQNDLYSAQVIIIGDSKFC